MQFIQFTAARADTGQVLPYAKVTVYLTGTSTLAALFNASGGSIANPVVADATGLVGFAAANGNYDGVVVSADGFYTSPTISRLMIYDGLPLVTAPVPLADQATITPNLTANRFFYATIAGNRTLGNPTNMSPGAMGWIRVQQDATGGRTLAFDTNWRLEGGSVTLSTAPNAVDLIFYQVISPTEILAEVRKGFAVVGASSYLGMVATRGGVPDSYNSGSTQIMSRSMHFATDNITQLKIVLCGWWSANGTETTSTGTATYTASVEYPSGTFTQIKWAGATSGSVAPDASVVSDYCTVTIPNGSMFWIRLFQTNASGIIYNSELIGNPNSALEYGTTLTDKTLGSVVTGAGSTLMFKPAAIIGMTNKATVVMLGDSRTHGASDGSADPTTGDYGAVRPSFNSIGYIDFSFNGLNTSHFVAANAPKRIALANTYTTHIFNYLGINNLINVPDTAAQLITKQQSLHTDWGASKPMIVATLDPYTTGTWATTGGQTVSSIEAQRVSYNNTVRARPTWAADIMQPTTVTETALNSGFWTPNYTTDGLHSNHTSYQALITANAFNPALFVR